MLNPTTNTATGWPDDGLNSGSSGRIRQLMSWWREVRDYCSDNRVEMAMDEDFVDSLQWTPAEKQELEARGQMPLVYNEIQLATKWITGTEKMTRVDWSVLPREPDDEQGAQIKTQVLKYLSDVNRFPFERSAAFEEAIKAGIGWLEVGIRHDGDEPIFISQETWRNIWKDPMSRKLDMSDCRYLMRSKVLDLDIACSIFPDATGRLRMESDSFARLPWRNNDIDVMSGLYTPPMHNALYPSDMDYHRPVVRLVECWYRSIENVNVLRGGSFSGQIFNENVLAHQRALNDGRAIIISDVPKMVMRVAIFTLGGYLIYDQRSPYIHNQFPFVPIYAFRRAQDLQPYGVPRQCRDPQIDLNKRRSKALFILSTNKVIADEGAVDDPEAFEQEAARPDQIVWKKQNKNIEFINNTQLAESHLQLALQDSEFIRQTSGVTGENLGLDTNAISGKAIIAKQRQGGVTTAGLFDNLRLSTQLAGELLLSLVEQFYDEPKVIRIVGNRQSAQFYSINQPQPDGSITNDITARQADFKVSEADFNESYRQAMFESMMELISRQPPEIAMKLMDLVVDFSDLPNKDEIVKRIRSINGQSAPDDPNAAQMEQQQAMMMQQKQQQEDAKTAAEIDLKNAQASKNRAETEKIWSEIRSGMLNIPQPNRIYHG